MVVALGLVLADAISPIAGWLIALGSIVGTVLLAAAGQNPPSFMFLPLALTGVGWVLVGIQAHTPASAMPVAGQPL
jgi:hypothetical protein